MHYELASRFLTANLQTEVEGTSIEFRKFKVNLLDYLVYLIPENVLLIAPNVMIAVD